MARSIMTRAIAAFWLITLAAPANAQSNWAPEIGTHRYRYESITHVPNASGGSYRLDYDLRVDDNGGIVAVVTGAWHRDRDEGEWSDAEVNDACRAKLHAQDGELARITLSPIAPELLQSFGPAFMDECAPAEIFFPATDILKLLLLQIAPEYKLAELVEPGDSRRFGGHQISLERLDTAISVDSPGGTVTFVSQAPGRITFDYAPDPSKLTTIHRRAYSGADVTLTGTDTTVYRIEINTADNSLLSVKTTKGAFDMVMSLPGGYSQPMAITHEVSIIPRP